MNSYDEYGIPASTNLGRFGYTGQAWLPELGMYYYKARIYSATLGRFMQTDPIGYDDGMNMYAYVGGDPVNNVDPTGLAVLPNGDIVVTAIRPKSQNGVKFRSIGRGSGSSANADRTVGDAKVEKKDRIMCPVIPASRPVGTIGEYGAGLRDPFGVPAVRVARDQAIAEAERAYPTLGGTDDVKDAFRHFYWVSAMTKLFGPRRALAFANSHEANYPIRTKRDLRSRQMDTFNNAIAIKMTYDRRFDGIPTAELAKIAINNGCLDIIK